MGTIPTSIFHLHNTHREHAIHMGGERAAVGALAIAMLLDGVTVPTQPTALRAIFRCRIRCALAAAVSAGLMDEANGDECAAALTQGAAQ